MRYKKIILGRLCYINTVLWRNHISFITLLREKLIWYFSNWNGRWQKLFGRCQNRQGTFYEGSSLGEVWIKILWEPWAVGQRLHPRLLVLFSQLFPLHPTSRQSPWPRGGQVSLCTGIFTLSVLFVCLSPPGDIGELGEKGGGQSRGWAGDPMVLPAKPWKHQWTLCSLDVITTVMSHHWWHPVSIELVWFSNCWIWIWMSLPGASGLGNQISWWWWWWWW